MDHRGGGGHIYIYNLREDTLNISCWTSMRWRPPISAENCAKHQMPTKHVLSKSLEGRFPWKISLSLETSADIGWTGGNYHHLELLQVTANLLPSLKLASGWRVMQFQSTCSLIMTCQVRFGQVLDGAPSLADLGKPRE